MIEATYENFIKMLDNGLTIKKIREEDSTLRKGIQNIKNGSQIYIWPFGRMGEIVYENLKANGYDRIILVDKSFKFHNTITPDELVFEEEDVLIISTLRHCNEIYNLAEKKNVKIF